MGAYTDRTNCWDRSLARGNSPRGAVDARIYGFRHGVTRQKGAADAYRFNLGFFDGHVESLGDLQGSNPELWLPKGAYYDPSAGFPMPADTARAYGGNVARVIR